MSMWDPFTVAGRRAMVLAQEAAQRRRINYIGPDEIFIAAIVAGENPATEAIRSFGITDEKLNQVEASLPAGKEEPTPEMLFTPEAKRLIELAFEEARRLQHNYIGAEHLVLAFLRERGKQSVLVSELGIEPGDLRAKVLELMPRFAAERGREPGSLDLLFTSVQVDKIRAEQLWSILRAAAETENAEKAWVSAFCIAKRNGWSLREAAAKVQKFLE